MNLEEYQKNLNDLIDKNANIINENYRNKISNAIEEIVKNFKGDKTLNKDLINDSSLILSEIILNFPINDNLAELTNKYAELLFNWNSNIAKEKRFEILSIYMSRISELRNEMVNSINTMKIINDRYKDLAAWTPPVFEISKAYFEELLKKHESEENVTNEEGRCS
jgi:hypothetical protein